MREDNQETAQQGDGHLVYPFGYNKKISYDKYNQNYEHG
jgi:hypothetical protein